MDSKADELPLSDKFWTWFEANKKPSLIGLGIVLLAVIVAVIVGWKRSETETASSEAVSSVTINQAMGLSTNAASEYLRVASEYSKTPAGAQALLLGATTLFIEGKYDQAITHFERFGRDYPENPLMGQAVFGVAACLEAQGKTNEATAAYKSLVERHPTDPVAPRAHLALGGLYESQGKPELARAEYEAAYRSEQPFGGGGEAQARMQELLSKHPELIPPAPAPTTMNSPVSIRTNPPQLRVQGSNVPPAVSGTNVPAIQVSNAPAVKSSTNPPVINIPASTNK